MPEHQEAAVTTPAKKAEGLRFRRRFTRPGEDPFEAIEWEHRDTAIVGADGDAVFEQKGVEVPASWSQTATQIVAAKYFHGAMDSPERETSVRQLVGRVVETLGRWGRDDGYFDSEDSAEAFTAELAHLLLHQMAAFNSPVWFNLGVEPRPQCSACFIQSLADDMHSIFDLAKTEGLLFKQGSGTGTNFSSLRGSMEGLSGGGTASGPVSFMRGFDSFAGVVKSGGRTRRAAKMVILDAEHPDVLEFVRSKALEESKARALVAAGFDGGFDEAGGAYESVAFQNANHSVRASDSFMEAAAAGGEWTTHAVTDGRPVDTMPARELLREIAEAAWACGDPGLQLSGTINRWHTCPESGPIRASNPCSEYLFLDDTACNLASLNLMRFYRPGDGFDAPAFRHASEVVITAQEILVSRAGYPTPAIAANSERFRPLGIGYSNLGALLMAEGLPYDSAAGRALAAAVTALMTGAAYAQSARTAAELGPFEGFEANREPVLRVLGMHSEALGGIDVSLAPVEVLGAAAEAWEEALELAEKHGVRNSQISVLAPTGTISFMMDCDTTGVEPDLALVKTKRLVGGGSLRIVNHTVPMALEKLGYEGEEAAAILGWVDEHGTAEGAPGLVEEHLAVFDCALKPAEGSRSIHYDGHLRMLAAVQPFISGAISKTLNVPHETTAAEMEEIYLEAWRLGLKAVAIYRDGCKSSQPLSLSKGALAKGSLAPERAAHRRRLPAERQALTHKFSVGGHEGYITVGLYEDGQPGEIFLVMAKEGSTISGLMDGFATAVSIALQYGVPLPALIEKFSHMRFEPSGFTGNSRLPMAKSILDYVFRWLASKFLSPEEQRALGLILGEEEGLPQLPALAEEPALAAPHPAALAQQDAPACQTCGAIMVRSGTCYACSSCGATSGCG